MPEPAQVTRRGLVLFGLMSVIWGIPYLFIRVAVTEISPAVLVLARTALAAAILLPIALLRVDLRPLLARWRWVVAFTYVNPAVAAVLGVLVLHETFSVAMGVGFGLVILGSTLATRPSRAVQEPVPAPMEAALPTTPK